MSVSIGDVVFQQICDALKVNNSAKNTRKLGRQSQFHLVIEERKQLLLDTFDESSRFTPRELSELFQRGKCATGAMINIFLEDGFIHEKVPRTWQSAAIYALGSK
tara:strand:- start:438 stop:752 length:315 start_codon:yes stop_codon:yes gene_type:complete